MGSETLSSACYILSDKSSIPFYSKRNGYNESAGAERLKIKIIINGLNECF